MIYDCESVSHTQCKDKKLSFPSLPRATAKLSLAKFTFSHCKRAHDPQIIHPDPSKFRKIQL